MSIYDLGVEFVNYCLEHGKHLKSHKEFGVLSSRLLSSIQILEGSWDDDIIRQYITRNYYALETILTLPLVNSTDPEIKYISLVYIYDHQSGKNEYVYKFWGARM